MIGSAICLPTGCTGFSAFMAPWKMIEMSFQRILLMPYSVRLARFLPSKSTSPLTMRPFSGSSLRMARAAVVLPQPRLAGQAQALAVLEHEAHAVDGLDVAVAQLEVGLEVAHVEHALVLDALRPLLGGCRGRGRARTRPCSWPPSSSSACGRDQRISGSRSCRRTGSDAGHGVVGLPARRREAPPPPAAAAAAGGRRLLRRDRLSPLLSSRLRSLGSRTSSKAVPMKVKASTTRTMAMPGGSRYHQAGRPAAPDSPRRSAAWCPS